MKRVRKDVCHVWARPSMNQREKKSFIRDLSSSVIRQLIEDVPKMPVEWNGHELRALMANRFNREVCEMSRAQKKDFSNECYIRNL